MQGFTYILAVTFEKKNGQNLGVGDRGKMKQGRKEGRKEAGNRSVKQRNFPYFVSLFNMGPFDRQKSLQKQGRISKIQG